MLSSLVKSNKHFYCYRLYTLGYAAQIIIVKIFPLLWQTINYIADISCLIIIHSICRVIECPKDCSGHGYCNTTSETCVCDSGWSSDACDVADTDCPNNCSSQGTCQQGHCQCDRLWTGEMPWRKVYQRYKNVLCAILLFHYEITMFAWIYLYAAVHYLLEVRGWNSFTLYALI